jgi:CHAT domain-containing protein/Flp pilus assembly protein TadD
MLRKSVLYFFTTVTAIAGAQTGQEAEDPQVLIKQATQIIDDSAQCHTRPADTEGKAVASAVDLYLRAASLWRERGDRIHSAEALSAAGNLQWRSGKHEGSLLSLSEAESVYRASGNQRKLADVLLAEGRTKQALARINDALENYAAARSIYETLFANTEPDKADSLLRQLGIVSNEIGRAHFWRAEYENALIEYHHALDIWAKPHQPNRSEAFTHQLLGRLYTRLGSYENAITELQTAYKFQKTLCDPAPAHTLTDLGVALLRKGNAAQAAKDFNDAEQIERELGDPEGLAETLSNEAVLHLHPGRLHNSDLALQELGEALPLQLRAKDKAGEIDTRLQIAWALAGQNRWRPVLKYLLETGVVDLARGILYYPGEAEAHYLLGHAYSAAGNPAHAVQEFQVAVEIQESQHEELTGGSLHASFSANARPYYESYIQALEEQARLSGGNFSATAFEMSERSRSRALLEHLNKLRVDLRKGVSTELLARENFLRRNLSERYRFIAYAPNPSLEETRKKRAEAAAFESELETVEAEIRSKTSVRIFSAMLFKLKDIQQVLDKDTVVLEYFLGQTHSYLWGITQNQFLTFQLPDRKQIEQASSLNYVAAKSVTTDSSLLSKRGAALAQLVLYPARALMARKKVVIVPDGALFVIPFAALPLLHGKLLIENHQIAVLPSLSIVSALRAHSDAAAPPAKTIAIFADPVFSKTDDRLSSFQKPSENPAAAKSAASVASDEYLPRLHASKKEANVIAGMIPPQESRQYLGFHAALANVTPEVLSGFRVLHFSTHAISDTVHPQFSRLVFTLFDSKGKKQPGVLLLSDIYNLRLRSDLVTLSSCDSGIGKEIEGEGPMSLSRGFLSAGSRAVLTTLWKVDDDATAEFMQRFYRRLLREHKPAIEALHFAQMQMMRHQNLRLRNPYYWAAFELQGDWQ